MVAKESRVMPQYEVVALMNMCEDNHVFHVNVHRTLMLLLLQMRAIRPQEYVAILGNKDFF